MNERQPNPKLTAKFDNELKIKTTRGLQAVLTMERKVEGWQKLANEERAS
jgi:hypothetical protein